MIGQFRYQDRAHAGKVLAESLVELNLQHPIILALPRGGLPIAAEVARQLATTLDVLIVRKIGAPFNPEYGIGAICEDLVPVMSAQTFLPMDEIEEDVAEIIKNEKQELTRRVQLYRGERKLPDLRNQTVILVDDGLATGVTAAAAGKYVKSMGAKLVILAVPVGPQQRSSLLTKSVDQIVCPYTPSGFSGVGNWYFHFSQVTDDEVIRILDEFHPRESSGLSLV
jgi:predicted phosphoribosyltransferase